MDADAGSKDENSYCQKKDTGSVGGGETERDNVVDTQQSEDNTACLLAGETLKSSPCTGEL